MHEYYKILGTISSPIKIVGLEWRKCKTRFIVLYRHRYFLPFYHHNVLWYYGMIVILQCKVSTIDKIIHMCNVHIYSIVILSYELFVRQMPSFITLYSLAQRWKISSSFSLSFLSSQTTHRQYYYDSYYEKTRSLALSAQALLYLVPHQFSSVNSSASAESNTRVRRNILR